MKPSSESRSGLAGAKGVAGAKGAAGAKPDVDALVGLGSADVVSRLFFLLGHVFLCAHGLEIIFPHLAHAFLGDAGID